MSSPIHTLMRRWKVLLFGGIIVAVFSLGASLLMPLEYRADAQLLIIARQQYGVDPFTVSKSAERIAETLATTIETDDFFNQVMQHHALGEVRIRFDALDARDRRAAWQRAVDGAAVFGTNMMTISAYDRSADNARALATAVSDTVVRSGSGYVGTLIDARVVNQAISSNLPVRPNLLVNVGLGFIVGVLGTAFMTLRKRKQFLS